MGRFFLVFLSQNHIIWKEIRHKLTLVWTGGGGGGGGQICQAGLFNTAQKH